MKYTLWTFIFCLLSFYVFSQSLNNLDKINGFRKFKFGTSIQQVSNYKPKPRKMQLRNVVDYIYTGTDIQEFAGIPIEEIMLSYFKNKLYEIVISFGTIYKAYTTTQFNIIQANLEANFSSEFHQCNDNPNVETLSCSIWDSQNVRLENIRMNLSEKDGTRDKMFNYLQGYILFTDKRLKLEQNNNEIQ